MSLIGSSRIEFIYGYEGPEFGILEDEGGWL
jgi:hypothetical protein